MFIAFEFVYRYVLQYCGHVSYYGQLSKYNRQRLTRREANILFDLPAIFYWQFAINLKASCLLSIKHFLSSKSLNKFNRIKKAFRNDVTRKRRDWFKSSPCRCEPLRFQREVKMCIISQSRKLFNASSLGFVTLTSWNYFEFQQW